MSRCIGRLYETPSTAANMGSSGSSKVAQRVTVNEVLLKLLVGLYNGTVSSGTGGTSKGAQQQLAVRRAAAVALWSVLHQSEKAKQVARELLLRCPEESSADSAAAAAGVLLLPMPNESLEDTTSRAVQAINTAIFSL
jgi:hypothetical protein